MSPLYDDILGFQIMIFAVLTTLTALSLFLRGRIIVAPCCTTHLFIFKSLFGL